MENLPFDPRSLLVARDPRETPTYGIPEAAHYLRIPQATLRSWVIGRDYQTEAGKRRFKPLIQLADQRRRLLSFENLAEAHVLSACRRAHKIPLSPIRAALDYVARAYGSKHPLIERDFETDGASLFINHLGKLINASEQGQVMMREVVQQHLKRLDRDGGRVVRLYPFTRTSLADSPKSVVIDPKISFGRPVLATARIPTSALAERYRAGESIDHLAEDYGCTRLEVEEAIRCEINADKAA